MGIETALILGTAASVGGSLMAASGAKAAGKATMQTARFNKAVRDRNDRVAQRDADLRERVGEREVREFREDFGKLQSRGEVAYMKGGVQLTGTPLLVLANNATEAAEDIQTINLAAATEAGRSRERGVNERLAGQLTLLEGRQRQQAYNIQAKGKMLDAVSSAAWGGYKYAQIT